ncbi:hypothetical protein DXB51_16140 [Bacillus cereus]|uniref:Uncharacterized protein n=1 Tax=Bacillus luti TaxID=2026191 RepID=A0ABU8HYA5_9BACI|nr:hypothetical protein [Bacillus luti]RGN76874.1 hypothetical protein DXB51_16140 [Bacillus cereus]
MKLKEKLKETYVFSKKAVFQMITYAKYVNNVNNLIVAVTKLVIGISNFLEVVTKFVGEMNRFLEATTNFSEVLTNILNMF